MFWFSNNSVTDDNYEMVNVQELETQSPQETQEMEETQEIITQDHLATYTDYERELLSLYARITKNNKFLEDTREAKFILTWTKITPVIIVHKKTGIDTLPESIHDDALIVLTENYHVFKNGFYFNGMIKRRYTKFEKYIRKEFHVDFDVLVKYLSIKFYSPDEYARFVNAKNKKEFPALLQILDENLLHIKDSRAIYSHNLEKWQAWAHHLPMSIDTCNTLCLAEIYNNNDFLLSDVTCNLFSAGDIYTPHLSKEYYEKEYIRTNLKQSFDQSLHPLFIPLINFFNVLKIFSSSLLEIWQQYKSS
jgi:hypothetical protein